MEESAKAERTRVLRYLDQDFTRPVRDPLWRHIYLSSALDGIRATAEFQKLHGIKQLGPAYLVYPGATHTRYIHSLGVFHLARRMIRALVLKDRYGLYTVDGVKSYLCAALLHDLGHFPHAHALKDLDLVDHETLTGDAIMGSPALGRLISEELGVPPADVASIVDFRRPLEGSDPLVHYRKLLSGVLEPDKLDYLNRDAYYCGVPYGIQDIDFIFNEVEPHPQKGIALSRKGLGAVESVLFSKYLMYRNVYWHRVVRLITAMIKKAILMGLESRVISESSLYGLDDEGFFSVMSSVSYPPFDLVKDAVAQKLYRTVAQVPFDEDSPLHLSLENPLERLGHEARIADQLSKTSHRKVQPEEVIIDVPERQSFEIDVPIRDLPREEREASAEENWVPFAESSTVFSGQVVRGFTTSLRHISLHCPEDPGVIEALLVQEPLGQVSTGEERVT
jgi:HD superfamily phosphohydrolase